MGDNDSIKRICVFCGSKIGARSVYTDVAQQLGKAIASHGIGLVYGGGSIGLMGVIADAVLKEKGNVIGVIPHALASKEFAHPGLTATFGRPFDHCTVRMPVLPTTANATQTKAVPHQPA